MYYPQSEITPNQYSETGLIYKDTGLSYKGYYYATSDGRFFEGPNFTPKAKELINTSTRSNRNTAATPTYHYPVPTEENYSEGYILRYFTIRVNSGFETITEVSKDVYTTTIPNPLYSQAVIKWRITGKVLDDTTNPLYTVPGVISENRQAIKEQEHLIPGIKNYLTNLIQYHK